MALTRQFRETVAELCKNQEYRRGLIQEAIETYLEGDVPTGNSLLKDYMNGTQTFALVADRMQIEESSLRRMVGPNGNPTAKNIFLLIQLCLEQEGVQPSIQVIEPRAA